MNLKPLLLATALLAGMLLMPTVAADHGPNPFQDGRCIGPGDPTTAVGLVMTIISGACVFTISTAASTVEFAWDARDFACGILGAC